MRKTINPWFEQSDIHRAFQTGFTVGSMLRMIKGKELTPFEINDLYPHLDSAAFTEGMLDGLKNDSWRLNNAVAKTDHCINLYDVTEKHVESMLSEVELALSGRAK